MASKDIEKLKERIDKDPNSKFFVPLAEEYRKEGMLDDAIGVLIQGIEKQPAYMSARVLLGKIYLEKEMPKEAQSEFENVIRSIPDNLYAHKKLAEIYKDSGRIDLSIKSYRTVLKLNALDEEAAASLKELEGGGREQGHMGGPMAEFETTSLVQQPAEIAQAEEEEEATSEETALDVLPVSDPEELDGPQMPDDEFSAFKDSLFGEKSAEGRDKDKVAADDSAMDVSEEQIEIETAEEDSAFGDFVADLGRMGPGKGRQAAAERQNGRDPDSVFSIDDDFDSGTSQAASQAVGPNIEEADRLISDGDYLGAMRIFRGMLADNPSDKKALQRVEELRSLLKLMGKDKEALIFKLNTFLEGVNKRRDEFLRRS